MQQNFVTYTNTEVTYNPLLQDSGKKNGNEGTPLKLQIVFVQQLHNITVL